MLGIEFLTLLEHLKKLLHPPGARLGFLGAVQPEVDGVAVGATWVMEPAAARETVPVPSVLRAALSPVNKMDPITLVLLTTAVFAEMKMPA